MTEKIDQFVADIKHSLKFDFPRQLPLLIEARDHLASQLAGNKTLTLNECNLLRLLCKTTFFNSCQHEVRESVHQLVIAASKAHDETIPDDKLNHDQIFILLTISLYWVELQVNIAVEKVKRKFLGLLKEIYSRHPDDFFMTRHYTKSLLLLHGTVYFSLMLDEMMEDLDSKKQYDEAAVLVQTLETKHGYSKFQKNLLVFKLIGTGNLLSVKDMISTTRREILKSADDSWHTHLLRIYLADVFVQLEATSSSLAELSHVEKALEGDKYTKVPYGYHLKCTMLIQQCHSMSKSKLKYADKLK